MAKTEVCPFCGASVKAENLSRHLDTNHPRSPEARALREKLRRDPDHAPTSRARPRLGLRKIHIAVIAAVVVLAVGAYYVSPLLTPASGIVAYCGGEGTAQHYHTLLVINVNRVQQVVPADIGISPSETNPKYPCPSGDLHALHTHDGSGIIHAELPASITVTPSLADFFSIWGQTLTTGTVWSYSGTVSAQVYDMGSGQSRDYSSNPASIPLTAPPNGRDAYAIPQNLIFNGAYGNGQSGGYFSGEIVYLNVTS